MKRFNQLLKSFIQLGAAFGLLALFTPCASPLTAKVASFNHWLSEMAGNTFSYIAPADKTNDLKQEAYEDDNEDLYALVPYLLKAAFYGFPCQNGRFSALKFDRKTH